MKKNFSISVPKPCVEKWGNFTTTSTGGFCASCNKNVVDFSRMSETQITEFFSTHISNTCGRFRPDQIKPYPLHIAQHVRPGMLLLKAGLLGLGLLATGREAFSQSAVPKSKIEISRKQKSSKEYFPQATNPYIRGIVKSEDDESPVPGVNVWLKGTSEGTITDIDGRFEFPRKLQEGDVLVFSFIGFMSTEYTVRNKNNEDVVVVMLELKLDIMGEVAVDRPYSEKKSGLHRLWTNVKAIF